MKREDLEKLGLSKEQIDTVMAENGKDVEAQKAKTTAAEAAHKTAADQLTEANKQIEQFRALPKVEDVQKAADEYKTKFEQAQKDNAAQLAALKFDHALDAALTGAKVKDPIAVRAHLKADALKLNEDGTILGLKEQLDPLKTSHDYLFEGEVKDPHIVSKTNNSGVITDSVVDAARKAAGLSSAQ